MATDNSSAVFSPARLSGRSGHRRASMSGD